MEVANWWRPAVARHHAVSVARIIVSLVRRE